METITPNLLRRLLEVESNLVISGLARLVPHWSLRIPTDHSLLVRIGPPTDTDKLLYLITNEVHPENGGPPILIDPYDNLAQWEIELDKPETYSRETFAGHAEAIKQKLRLT
jgi:hypothetical protein